MMYSQNTVKNRLTIISRGFVWMVAAFFYFLAAPAYAHKVNMFAYIEGDKIFIEGYFADGKKAERSEVSVYGAGDEVLYRGATDAQGMLSFPIPRKADLKIVLDAGMGHRTEYRFAAGELTGAGGTGGGSSADTNVTLDPAVNEVPSTDEARLQAVVRKAVADAVKPLARDLNEYKAHASMTEIIGGIGYIFGVLGVFAYLKSRKHA